MLPLLSDSLKNLLLSISEENDSDIINDLLAANELVEIARSFNDPNFDKSFSKNISQLINDNYRMLTFRQNELLISFLPKGKDPIYTSENKWGRANRQFGKPARIIQNLLVKKYSCKEFEDFQNFFKAKVSEIDFRIVEGSDITKYYNKENYYQETGTLGNSCMRYSTCESFFAIYEDYAKMLVAFKDDKVAGRALIWEINGETYMDRVYTYVDYLYNAFIMYAEDHHWYHREDNSLLSDGDDQNFVGPKDDYERSFYPSLELKINPGYEIFPYMDSFRYYCRDTNTLCTSCCDDCIYLSNTDGRIGESYYCADCGREFISNEYPEELHYSEYADRDLCNDCCWYCEYLRDYIPDTDPPVEMKCGSDISWDVPVSYVEDPDEYEEINDIYYELSNYTEEELEAIRNE